LKEDECMQEHPVVRAGNKLNTHSRFLVLEPTIRRRVNTTPGLSIHVAQKISGGFHSVRIGASEMSALGRKQACAAQKVKSALPPKADIEGTRDNKKPRALIIADLRSASNGDGFACS
jgi:hypothetical protein